MNVLVKDGVVYEGVLSVIHDGSVYAATVGFIKNDENVVIKVYKGGLLERITRLHNRVVLNLTHDPIVLTSLAFKGILLEDSSLKDLFIIHGDKPVLVNGFAYLVLDKIDTIEKGDHVLLTYRIVEIKTRSDIALEPYTRCYSSIIEIAVYLSKIMALNRDRELISEYYKRVELLKEVVNKTCNEKYIGYTRNLLVKVSRLIGQDSN